LIQVHCGSKYRRWTSGQQALRGVELSIDKCRVEDQLRVGIGDLSLAPALDLPLHRLEIPLHAVHADGDRVHQAETLRVFCKYRREIAVECHVVADEYTVSHRHRESHRFVVRVADADREAAAGERRLQIEDAEHLHSVLGDGVFVLDDRDVPEGEGLQQRGNHLVVRYWVISLGRIRYGN
jgi:hypothetical protein